ncbi:MAG: GNAT family N-acetyltransferase [Firmicutes bacterium]|nr:GNAT family N-acetyltransferase [Bacillota bacterium]
MKNKITIKNYDQTQDADAMFELMRLEGDWNDYCDEPNVVRYKVALKDSVTFVLYRDNTLCGFVRVRDDFGFGVYIHDLLVGKAYRGNGYGKKLIEFVADNFAGNTIYVMSDVDEYYRKQGYDKIEGRIIIVRK